jgi:hypothetical protein
MLKKISLSIFLLPTFFLNSFSQTNEALTITTYYPSPYGVYKEIRAKRMAIGDNYYDYSQYCWSGRCAYTIDSDADLIIQGNVGIGDTTPDEDLKLDVEGKVGAAEYCDENGNNCKAITEIGGSLDCTTVSQTSGSSRNKFASCPSGYRVTGGGCDFYYYGYQAQWNPLFGHPEGNGYRCRGENVQAAYAQCCRIE